MSVTKRARSAAANWGKHGHVRYHHRGLTVAPGKAESPLVPQFVQALPILASRLTTRGLTKLMKPFSI